MSVDIHCFKGFCENFTYLVSINKGITATPKSAHTKFLGNFPRYSLSLLVKSVEEEVQLSSDRVDSTKVWTLE